MNWNEAMVECVQRDEAIKTDTFKNLVFYPDFDSGHIMAEHAFWDLPFEIAFQPSMDDEWELG